MASKEEPMVSPISSELYPRSSSETLVLNETTSDSAYESDDKHWGCLRCLKLCCCRFVFCNDTVLYECARDCGCRNENRAIYQVKDEEAWKMKLSELI